MAIKISNRKKVIIIAVIAVLILAPVGYALIQEFHLFGADCHNIVGDGYDMGTDPEPVVIGNTCD